MHTEFINASQNPMTLISYEKLYSQLMKNKNIIIKNIQ